MNPQEIHALANQYWLGSASVGMHGSHQYYKRDAYIEIIHKPGSAYTRGCILFIIYNDVSCSVALQCYASFSDNIIHNHKTPCDKLFRCGILQSLRAVYYTQGNIYYVHVLLTNGEYITISTDDKIFRTNGYPKKQIEAVMLKG